MPFKKQSACLRKGVKTFGLILALACTVTAARAQNYFGSASELPFVTNTVNTRLSLDSLQIFLKQLTGELPVVVDGQQVSIPHRYAGNGSQEYRDAARFIANTFDRYGLNPVLENNVPPYLTLNVIGTLPGRRAEYVVICGHYDSRSVSCPGADDNASGTAAVLEAARLLHTRNAFEYTIKFIAFGGEELGLLGSKAYVAAHPDDSIRAVINLDMIAWDGNSNRVVQVHSQTPTDSNKSDDLYKLISDVDEVYALPTEVQLARPGISASDHAPFWQAGHPAVLFIEEYGTDFNPYYHTDDDTWLNISGAQHQLLFKSITQLAVASVMHLAVPLDPLLGIDLQPATAAKLRVGVYPNPAHGRASIAWSAPDAGEVRIVITDLLGRVVLQAVRNSVEDGTNIETANLSGIPAGVYMLRLSAGEATAAVKLLVR